MVVDATISTTEVFIMKHNVKSENDYASAIRKHTIQATIACAFCWGVSTFVMVIGAFAFLSNAISIIVTALLWAFILLLPVFRYKLFQLGSFDGMVTAIDCHHRYKLYMIKPGVGKSAVQNRSEYTLYIQKDNGKTATVTYVIKEDRQLPYRAGDRVRYRWGLPYMEILSSETAHSAICPFCGEPLASDAQTCHYCHRKIGERNEN